MRVERQTVLLMGCAGLMLALASCKQAPEMPSMLSPYKIDIQQGNVVTQEMLSKLKAGMTRSQVRFVLGSPLVVDPFRTDRWDYVSMFQKQGKDVERRRLTVIFDDDKLVRIEGDVTLTDSSLATEAVPVKPATVEKPPAAVEPVKPVVKPVATEVAKPPVAKPVASPVAPIPVAPSPVVAKPEPVKPGTEKTVSPSELPKAVVAKPVTNADAASDAASAEPAKTTSVPDEKKADAAKKDAPKEKPKPGFFGRMLDKLGI